MSGEPIGNLTPVPGTSYAKDAAGRIYQLTDIDRLEAIRRRRYAAKDRRTYSFTHMRHIREITAELSNKYCGYLLMIQPYIAYKTNVLVRGGRANEPLCLDDIAQIWGVSRRTAVRILAEFERRSIVFESGGLYTINDRYHFRKRAGKEADVLIKTFSTTLKQFDLSAADLGFVYKLLPYVHYETNMVCADPFVAPHEIRFLSDKEIGKVVGMSETKTKETLRRLRKSGIIGEWINANDRREKLTVLNPYVFYRKQGEPDATLRALFGTGR